MAPQSTLYVITPQLIVEYDDNGLEGLRGPEVYDSKDLANKAAKLLLRRIAERFEPTGRPECFNFVDSLDNEGLYHGRFQGGTRGKTSGEVCVYKVLLNKPNTKTTARLPINDPELQCVHGFADGYDNGEEAKKEEEEEEDEEKEEEKEVEPKSSKSNSKKATQRSKSNSIKAALNPVSRKTIPKGKRNCLADVKILFTGTFNSMDRVTSIATAKKYGADVVTKLEDTDYIVLGDRAGPKKLQVINELELETITEDEFFDILENGISAEKRQRMNNKRRADEDEGPEQPAKVARTGKGLGKRAK